LLLGAWVALGAERRAWAGTSDIVTRVACPALPTDIRAEFEARAQVDLTLRSAGGGDLEVICRDLTAKVTWRPKAGGSFERDASAATPGGLVDALLFAVAELASESARAQANRPPPPPTGADTAVAPSTPDGAAESTAESPADAVPPAAAGERRSAGGGLPAIPIGITGGGTASLFSTSGAGAAGPHAGFIFRLPASLLLTLEGGYGFGFGAISPVSVHTLETSAVVSTVFGSGRTYELGGGVLLGQLSASATGLYSPQSDTKVYFAALARARYGGMVGGWRLAFGPEVRLNLPPTEVVVRTSGTGSENTAWDISAVTVGITLDIATSLYGSLW
jgi:hypothetical protein